MRTMGQYVDQCSHSYVIATCHFTFDFGIDCYFQCLMTISISIFQLKKSSIFFMLFCMCFLVSFHILKSTITCYLFENIS